MVCDIGAVSMHVGRALAFKGKNRKMPLTLGDKTLRTIRFLLGLRNPRIATALAGYGFKNEDMVEGWNLINALGKGRLAVLPPGPRDMETLLKLLLA
jgi:hypothetical protein